MELFKKKKELKGLTLKAALAKIECLEKENQNLSNVIILQKENFQLIIATQMPSDMIGTKADSLVSICKRKVYFGQAEGQTDYLISKRALTKEQAYYLDTCNVGEALLKINNYNNEETHIKRINFFKEF